MIVAECESDPDPRMSFHRDTDVIATVAVMPQNVNELADVQDMLSVTWRRWVTRKYSERKHGSQTKSTACWEEIAEEVDGEKQERERGNVDTGGLLVRKKPLSRS